MIQMMGYGGGRTTSHYLYQWCIYASLGLNELTVRDYGYPSFTRMAFNYVHTFRVENVVQPVDTKMHLGFIGPIQVKYNHN